MRIKTIMELKRVTRRAAKCQAGGSRFKRQGELGCLGETKDLGSGEEQDGRSGHERTRCYGNWPFTGWHRLSIRFLQSRTAASKLLDRLYGTKRPISRGIFFFLCKIQFSPIPLVQFLPNKMAPAWVSNEGVVTNQWSNYYGTVTPISALVGL